MPDTEAMREKTLKKIAADIKNPRVVQSVSDWLRTGQRPPTAAAKILIFAAILDRQHTPWPTRAAVADRLNVGISTVDIVLSNQQALGRLHIHVETPRGAVKQRLSVIQRKYVVPSPELIAIVEEAERAAHESTRRRVKRRQNPRAARVCGDKSTST